MYRVMVVEDNELPAKTDWVMVRTAEMVRLIVKRSKFSDPVETCRLLSRVWAARIAIEGDPHIVQAVA